MPNPVPQVGTISGYGEMSKAEIASSYGVIAKMKDFDFALSYEVLSYTMTYPSMPLPTDKSLYY